VIRLEVLYGGVLCSPNSYPYFGIAYPYSLIVHARIPEELRGEAVVAELVWFRALTDGSTARRCRRAGAAL
jgi:hypothetical protein